MACIASPINVYLSVQRLVIHSVKKKVDCQECEMEGNISPAPGMEALRTAESDTS